ncbi:hypothetical protein EVAR_56119_1 [Eumeta japonica]|uniref:Uncharacterized protein n=1 Tax=Eumeta variegata TaxID=151549 RepID=A0A4C1YFY1_EUMVA|nr:hypothetical protein EVAR_56119_1 [Eumeta japonica]
MHCLETAERTGYFRDSLTLASLSTIIENAHEAGASYIASFENKPLRPQMLSSRDATLGCAANPFKSNSVQDGSTIVSQEAIARRKSGTRTEYVKAAMRFCWRHSLSPAASSRLPSVDFSTRRRIDL